MYTYCYREQFLLMPFSNVKHSFLFYTTGYSFGCSVYFVSRVVFVSLQDFIVRLKTANVDVDSRGHSCKEKMMSVLAEEPCRTTTMR